MPLGEGRASRRDNPIVFLDVHVGAKPFGRLTIELRADVVPLTAENFRVLCTGVSLDMPDGKSTRGVPAGGAFDAMGTPKRYSGCLVHRVVRDSLLQAGDIDGEGGSCAFSTPTFEDENFILRHVGMGTVGMVNAGPDTNGSQFYICFTSAPWLDNKHVVFGALLGESSFETLAKLHDTVATESGQPLQVVRIAHSGQLYPV
ncbi:hypothetical protein H310_10093 [Aphanomyces invadans]|uniref:Peptidyl-prolyl cis-trans isomerase n=1 Tax=Aphanomyces invadans TaxID=157072 RepID=A0A024TRZ6_9STRA|nr:hypothetical protein H310_10093 [Aphanomyces invadans]ETV96789.1 hypothetical protein H310_10093 [Aphanomyces invadans]|eukprot:XP_008874567.1 hypothetical protein H310_10093 [Aphanomyces invadans]